MMMMRSTSFHTFLMLPTVVVLFLFHPLLTPSFSMVLSSSHDAKRISSSSVITSLLSSPARRRIHQEHTHCCDDVIAKESVVAAATSSSNARYVLSKRKMALRMSNYNTDDNIGESDQSTKDKNTNKNTIISKIYIICGILSSLAWIMTSVVALSYHPDPKFADCTLRHNVLTMGQAFAFPLPILWVCFQTLQKITTTSTSTTMATSSIFKRFNLGISVASIWLASSTSLFPSSFAFGYDLYTMQHKIFVGLIHGMTGFFTLGMAMRCSTSVGQTVRNILDSVFRLGPSSGSSSSCHKNSSAYAIGTVGLLYFAIQPVVSPYPLATIPTILGKRLSRPASSFTFLGAIIAYTLKGAASSSSQLNTSNDDDTNNNTIRNILRKGLIGGCSMHLILIFLKIIGCDGGGLIFPGHGLWEVYPAMISVPFASGVSFLVHAALLFAAMTDD